MDENDVFVAFLGFCVGALVMFLVAMLTIVPYEESRIRNKMIDKGVAEYRTLDGAKNESTLVWTDTGLPIE